MKFIPYERKKERKKKEKLSDVDCVSCCENLFLGFKKRCLRLTGRHSVSQIPTNDEVMVIIDEIYMCKRNFGIPEKCLWLKVDTWFSTKVFIVFSTCKSMDNGS